MTTDLTHQPHRHIDRRHGACHQRETEATQASASSPAHRSTARCERAARGGA
jgi:hypothetical protein